MIRLQLPLFIIYSVSFMSFSQDSSLQYCSQLGNIASNPEMNPIDLN
uniref:Secreted protein n=1 Tax=Ascaris lumbricoides TaxID=6252 RepID=A0A0M3IB56_ASCLU